MKIVYLGSGQFGIPSLDAIRDSSNSIELVVSQPASGAGRGRLPRPTPVAEWACKNDIEVLETPCCNAPPVIEHISEVQPDLIVVIAFGQRIVIPSSTCRPKAPSTYMHRCCPNTVEPPPSTGPSSTVKPAPG